MDDLDNMTRQFQFIVPSWNPPAFNMVYVLDLLLVEYSVFIKCPSLNPLKIDGRARKHAHVQSHTCDSWVDLFVCYPYVSRMYLYVTHMLVYMTELTFCPYAIRVTCVYSYVTCMCLYVLNYVTSMPLNINIKLVWCFIHDPNTVRGWQEMWSLQNMNCIWI